jgi:integrase
LEKGCKAFVTDMSRSCFTRTRAAPEHQRWQDIDLSNGIITIRRSKHGEARHIQINSAARAALLKLRERTGGPGYVCPGLDNSRKRYSRQWFEEVTEKAEISTGMTSGTPSPVG